MVIKPHDGYTEFETTLPSGRGASVTVYHRESYGGRFTVEVNWSALGSVAPTDAAAYAAVILAASAQAQHILAVHEAELDSQEA